jgi:putative transposase
LLTPDDTRRQGAYRELFDQVMSDKAITDIRLALKQTQPLGNSRFFDAIEQATGQRREAKTRGRPGKPEQDASPQNNPKQLGLTGLDQQV